MSRAVSLFNLSPVLHLFFKSLGGRLGLLWVILLPRLGFLSRELGKRDAPAQIFLSQKADAGVFFGADLLVSTIGRIISEHLIQRHRVCDDIGILSNFYLGIRGVPRVAQRVSL